MSRIRLHDLDFELFIPEAEVNAAVDRLAGELRTKYNGKRPLFVGVLNGAFFFAAELMKRLDIECEITFVKVASYLGTSSSGTRHGPDRFERTHRRPPRGGGGGHRGYRQYGEAHPRGLWRDHHPASVSIATLLFKPDAYNTPSPSNMSRCAFPTSSWWASGLDHDGLGRNLPGIYRIINGK
jgi:hypoxanthine-guanine phosphoribosyltransferase